MPLVSAFLSNSTSLVLGAFVGALIMCSTPHAGESQKSEAIAPGTENEFFVAPSQTELNIKKGVQRRIERTPAGVELHLTLPAAKGESDKLTLVCRCASGKSGSCSTSSTTHVAICGGDECCGWRSPPVTLPQGGGPVPPPP
jgi:hypothetical protein